jgi:hypothetical protein
MIKIFNRYHARMKKSRTHERPASTFKKRNAIRLIVSTEDKRGMPSLSVPSHSLLTSNRSPLVKGLHGVYVEDNHDGAELSANYRAIKFS